MSGTVIGLFITVLLFVMLTVRVHIGVAMFLAGAIGYTWMSGYEPLIAHLKHAVYGRFSVYDLSVIPLFLLMGQFATQGGLSQALFKAANSFIGHWRGGMAMAGIASCAVIGGIYAGLFTPTEAASVGTIATGLAAWKAGGLKNGGLMRSLLGTAVGTGMMFLILLGADMLNAFLAVSQIPAEFASWVQGLGLSPLVVMEIGLITPPVGMNVFIIHNIAQDISAGTIFKSVIPFLISDVFRIILLIMVPFLSLGVVRWLG